MAEFGEIQGLAQSGQFDQKINDLRYRNEAAQRARAIAESKAKLFSDDLDYQNSINSHDNPLIKQFAQNQIKKIGAYVRENPDWATNVDKRIQLNQLRRELKDNPDLHRGLASDTAYKNYLTDMAEVAKNPQQHDTQAYQDVANQWQNYLKFGNQAGEEAANIQGKQAFLYNKPRDFVDLNKAFQDIGNSFKDMKTRPIKGGRNAYEEYANPDSLRAVANQMYGQNKRQIDLEARKNGLDPITYIENGINAHIAKKRDFGDYGLSDAIAGANYKHKLEKGDIVNPNNAFDESFKKIDKGTVPETFLEQTYGPNPSLKIASNNGLNQIDITGNRVYYTGNHEYHNVPNDIKKPNGPTHKQKLVETYTYLPLEVAKEKGIYDDGNWNPFQGEEISPSWNRTAELVSKENNKGELIKMVKVKAMMPVEMNDSYAGAFNQQAHMAKSKLISETGSQEGEVNADKIYTDKNTGKSYKKVEGGWQKIN